jgi:seryl-tRNA synthetase
MLELGFIRGNQSRVSEGLKIRNYKDEDLEIIDKILDKDDSRKRIQTARDQALMEQNKLSKEIGELFRGGDTSGAAALKAQVSQLKESSQRYEQELKALEQELESLLLQVPNIPHISVPPGQGANDNEVFRAWDKPMPSLPEGAAPHWELAEQLGIVDFQLGVKLAGSGFPVFRGKGAKLERALISFFLDEAVKAGYEEVIPPLLVNEDTARGTGQLPDKEGQMYYVERDNLYLIPTAEVPITNIYRDAILSAESLPVKMCGYTPCFRREAGSYGAHVRGLNRVHQFDKVEIVRIEHPERSYAALEEMLAHVAGLLDRLGLPYRILRLCGGDMGFTSALTFDFEVFAAGQERWLEVSSVSNFETFQSNRMKLRFRDGKQTRLTHTLNGSALALARVVAALLENNQTPSGVVIPEVLHPYTGFEFI